MVSTRSVASPVSTLSHEGPIRVVERTRRWSRDDEHPVFAQWVEDGTPRWRLFVDRERLVALEHPPDGRRAAPVRCVSGVGWLLGERLFDALGGRDRGEQVAGGVGEVDPAQRRLDDGVGGVHRQPGGLGFRLRRHESQRSLPKRLQLSLTLPALGDGVADDDVPTGSPREIERRPSELVGEPLVACLDGKLDRELARLAEPVDGRARRRAVALDHQIGERRRLATCRRTVDS